MTISESGTNRAISYKDFHSYVSEVASSAHEVLAIGGRARFKVEVTQEGFVFIPASTKQARPDKEGVIRRVLSIHAATGSLKTTDYQQVTVNSSYQLGLIRDYLQPSRHTKHAADHPTNAPSSRPKKGPAVSVQTAIVIGERFKLRAPIHERFGGTKYSGIAPSKLGYVLAFTSPIGNDHGYVDGWSEDGDRFFYAGQGQIGDQNFDPKDNNGRNNIALLNHQKQGRKLVVFKGLPNRVYECMGEFVCVGHADVDGVGTDKQPRTVIKFELVPTVAKHGEEMDPEVSALVDIHGHEGKERLVTHRRRERDSALARAAKAKHGQAPCTCCGKTPAEVYGHRSGFGMDAHHVEPLGSRDSSTNTITRIEDLAIVCVLCHRALHTSRQDGSFPSMSDLQEHFGHSQ